MTTKQGTPTSSPLVRAQNPEGSTNAQGIGTPDSVNRLKEIPQQLTAADQEAADFLASETDDPDWGEAWSEFSNGPGTTLHAAPKAPADGSARYLAPDHRKWLNAHAITDETIARHGIHSKMDAGGHGTGVWLPWSDGTAHTQQLRPDVPRGKLKYIWPGGQTTILNVVRWHDDGPVLSVEGDKQHRAVDSWADPRFSVIGMHDCEGIHRRTDLRRFRDREVILAFDADWMNTGGVNDAARRVARLLTKAGATSVRAIVYPAGLLESPKDGMDDVLARTPEAERAALIDKLAAEAVEVPAAPLDGVDVSSTAAAREWLGAELGRGALSALFLRDGRIVHTPRIGEEGYRPPTDAEGVAAPGPAQVRPVGAEEVKALVEVRYDVGKEALDKATGGQVWVKAMFPRDAAVSAVSGAQISEGAPNLRTLRMVTHTPMVRRDGSVLREPGYDDATGTLYLPEPGLHVGSVADSPSDKVVRSAVEFLLKPVKDFPFTDANGRANWLGLMFTPLLRELLPPPYPMGIATATNRGSGKTWLMKMIEAVHGGEMHGPLPMDKDELRKKLTAVLVDSTSPVVIFDNLRGVIASTELEQMLTSDTYSDRRLGSNTRITMRNDRLWLATGNNVAIGGDLSRRIVLIGLDPKCAHAHRRTFDLDPLAWVSENRGQYLRALLTVARGWVQAGMPRGTSQSDNYAHWRGALRGLLAWAGVPGEFDGGDPDDRMASQDDDEWELFLTHVHRVVGAGPFEAREVVEKIQDHGTNVIAPSLLPRDLADRFAQVRGGSRSGFTRSVGAWFANRDGTYAGQWVARQEPQPKGSKKAKRYAVIPPDGYEPETVRPQVDPLDPFGG